MFSLVYVSSATQLFSQADLLDLLERSRRNNATLEITGMLLYKSGNFIQVLEGDEPKVRALEAKIAKDVRHRGMFVLLTQQQETRAFPEWSMGFRDLSDPNAYPPGFSQFLNVEFSDPYWRDPSNAQRLLLSFRRSMT